MTSAIWILALGDGTVDMVSRSIAVSSYKRNLQEKQEILQLEVNITELEITKKYRDLQKRYIELKLKAEDPTEREF
jgi:hypothetical protein